MRFEVLGWRGFIMISPYWPKPFGYGRSVCLGWYRKHDRCARDVISIDKSDCRQVHYGRATFLATDPCIPPPREPCKKAPDIAASKLNIPLSMLVRRDEVRCEYVLLSV
jgi:hypothetical protein